MNARLLSLALAVSVCGAFAQGPAAPAETEPPAHKKPALLKFVPPKGTDKGQRLDGDGGSRGTGKVPDWLCTMTPPTGRGLTTKSQPTLFTYQTEDANMIIDITVTEPGQDVPLLNFKVNGAAAGVHRVDLSEWNKVLKAGVEYEWSVVLRPDEQKRSEDLFAKGFIRRVDPDPALAAKIKAAAPEDLPAIYAEAGYWYDALAAISDQVALHPGDQEWAAARHALLEQVELSPEQIAKKVQVAKDKAAAASKSGKAGAAN